MQACRTAAAALLLMLSWLLPHTGASAQADVRYISDETAITLREDKGMNAPVAALLKSGTRVQLLQEDAVSGYSKVRVAQGREGWVLARYLSNEPAARERLATVQAQLAEQQALVRRLEGENLRLRQAGAPPSATPVAATAPVVAAPATDSAAVTPGPNAMMVTGAGLFVAGLLSGVLILMIPRSRPRKRWSAEL
jgi:SH3 domain protein